MRLTTAEAFDRIARENATVIEDLMTDVTQWTTEFCHALNQVHGEKGSRRWEHNAADPYALHITLMEGNMPLGVALDEGKPEQKDAPLQAALQVNRDPHNHILLVVDRSCHSAGNNQGYGALAFGAHGSHITNQEQYTSALKAICSRVLELAKAHDPEALKACAPELPGPDFPHP